MEEFVYHDAFAIKFDAGVFETEVGSWLGAGGKDDTIDIDHFFLATYVKDDGFDITRLGDGNNLGTWDNHDAEFIGEIIGKESADFFVFAREDARFLLHDKGAGAKFCEVLGDFATGGAAANDKDELR